MTSRLDMLAGKIKTKSGLAKYRDSFLIELNKAKRFNKISQKEYNSYKNYYNNRAEGENVKGLERLSQVPDSPNIQESKEAAIITLQQKKRETGTREITEITDTQGQTYKGQVVGEQFIGVRTVSKREQQLKANTRAGFYSILDSQSSPQKTTGQVITEQTAIRGSLGIYSPYSLSSDVKFEFEKPKEEKMTRTEAEKNAFKIVGGGIKQTGEFFTSAPRGILKTTGMVNLEFAKSQGLDTSKAPKWVQKFYDLGYKEFPTKDLSQIAILSTPTVFQGKNIITNIGTTKLGKVAFFSAEVGFVGYAGARFVTKPSKETFGDLLTVGLFPSYVKGAETLSTVYGKGVLKTSDIIKDTKIELAPFGKGGRIGGQSAKIRVGRKSKAQIRQESYGVYKNRNTFIDRQSGEVGIRIRNQELKTQQFTKERVIRVEPFSKDITQIKDVQLGGRGSLTTNFRDSFSFKGKPSQVRESKLYPKGFGTQRIRLGRQELIGITQISRGGFDYNIKQPKVNLPQKSLPKDIARINVMKGGNSVSTIGVTQTPFYSSKQYPLVEMGDIRIGGFRKGVTEKLIKNVRVRVLEGQQTGFIRDLSMSGEVLPRYNTEVKLNFYSSPERVVDVDTFPKTGSSLSLSRFPKTDIKGISSFDIKSSSDVKLIQSQAQAQSSAQSFRYVQVSAQAQAQSQMFDFKQISQPKIKQVVKFDRKENRTSGTITPFPKINNNFKIKQIVEKPVRQRYDGFLRFSFFPKQKSKGMFNFGFKSSVRQPKAYIPSLRASLFGLKGRKSNNDELTGLEERLL